MYVAATGNFHATLPEFAKLHENLEVAHTKLSRERKEGNTGTLKVSNGSSEKTKAVIQA